jgi:hypothetical protein
MRHRSSLLLGTLFAGLCACAQEATGPQGAASITRVVPVAVPDVWCTATADGPADTVAPQKRCQTTVNAPPPPPPAARDSTWHTTQGSWQSPGDSVTAPRDTTGK